VNTANSTKPRIKWPVVAAALLGDQPAGDRQQRQRQCQARAENAQLLLEQCAAVGAVGSLEQPALVALLRCQRLSRHQQPRIERLDAALRVAFACLQRVEVARALDHLGILFRIGGGGACADPVVVRVVCRSVGVGGGGEREAVARLFVLELLLLFVQLADLVARHLERHRVGELVLRQVFFEARQVGNDLAAQADQKTGEHERNNPHDQLEQPVGHTQELEHGGLPPGLQLFGIGRGLPSWSIAT
jgi:hypothetical protein